MRGANSQLINLRSKGWQAPVRCQNIELESIRWLNWGSWGIITLRSPLTSADNLQGRITKTQVVANVWWKAEFQNGMFGKNLGSFFQPSGPKRHFLGPNSFQRGPFLVGSCFDRNIGMLGVQIVATEFSDDFRQLQLILNHPVGEIVQKHHFGAF